MAGFSEVLAAARPADDGLCASVPESWHQGRTAYGGFSSALALSAALRIGDDLPPLRSAQVSMIAPLFGEVGIVARPLRRGRNAIWVEVEISGESGVGIAAIFVFMRPVESSVHINDCPPPARLIALDDAQPMAAGRGATFLRNHFDVRFALPRTGERHPEMCWWVRAREREGLDPMVELLLCADALPPGVMPLLAPTVPASTMQWQANLLTPMPATRDGWWLLRSTGDYAERGCSSQRMAVWNADGLPVMAGMQSFALFG